MKQYITTIAKLTGYNIKIIFGNKFIYFVLSAVGFYILAGGVTIFSDTEVTKASAYSIMLIPSILLIFYPTCFGIQNDQDSKIIEIIFGIPNYRYKIWLFRLLIAYIICLAITFILSLITNWIVVEISPGELTMQVMAPALFVGTLCFMLSTMVRNGNGTAVLIIIIGLLLFILNGTLGISKWNIFMNPFNIPLDKNPLLFNDTLFENRCVIFVSSVVFLLTGLYKTQNREKYI